MPALWLTVLAYHRIGEVDARSPWDDGVLSATPGGFRTQLEVVKRYFNPVTSEQVVLWKQGGFPMPRNPIVVTFDDGYLDNYRVALPVLLEAGVPADFFVCPWNIEQRRPFWWDKITYLLRRTRQDVVTLSYPEPLRLDLASEQSHHGAEGTLLRIVKHTPNLDIQRFVNELQEKTDVPLDEEKEANRLLMTWDHIRCLRRAGMGVGSHSYSHPVLPLTDEATTRREMVQSKSAIEQALGEKIRALAYPVGSFSNGTKALAREAGYEIAYSYCSGSSFLGSVDLLQVKRIAVEKYMSDAYFRTMLAMPFAA